VDFVPGPRQSFTLMLRHWLVGIRRQTTDYLEKLDTIGYAGH
jgi:hypothetical protein